MVCDSGCRLWLEEWKHASGEEGAEGARVEAMWTVVAHDRAPPRPNLHLKDDSRGIEMNLTPEGAFYRYPNRTDDLGNWTLMCHGYWQ